MTQGNPAIKDKALALPQTFGGGNFFEIAQNSAFEVKYLRKALLQHIAGGFFAADTAGAKHRDLFVLGRIEVVFHIIGKFTKRARQRINGPRKTADPDLLVIAGINHDHIGVADDRIPVFGRDIGADLLVGINAVNTQCDNLFLQAHFQPQKWHLARLRPFMVDGVETGQTTEGLQNLLHRRARTGHGAVDPFRRQKGNAPDPEPRAGVAQRRLQITIMGQAAEMIKGRDRKRGCGVITQGSIRHGLRGGLDWVCLCHSEPFKRSDLADSILF